ncbi:hypothetical protein ACOSP7_012411 [Xanthoceras sorbifolium]
MPFALFTGVNHHLQSIQFGCALLQDETEALSDTHYRLCLWHIKKKLLRSYHMFTLKKNFEEKWKILAMENGLEKNEWLNHLYKIHASWVPAYDRRNFFAGMNTTGRSEKFVIKYEQTLKKIIKNESYEDFESEYKYRIVDDGEFLLKHASQLYTRRVFNNFKDEWYKLNLQTYKGMCECQTFEFVGILCRHFLKVFVQLDIDMIPDHFFRIMDSKDHLVKNGGKEESEALRLGHMCHQVTKLACIATSPNEKYMIYMEVLNELSKKLSEVFEHQTKISHKKDDPWTNIHFPQHLLLDPNISQTKGKKKDVESSRRIKSSIEVALNKKKRTCRLCSKFRHDNITTWSPRPQVAMARSR